MIINSVQTIFSGSFSSIHVNIESNQIHELTIKDYFVYVFFGTIFTVVFFVYVVYAYNYLTPFRIFKNRKKLQNSNDGVIRDKESEV